jgi:putative intracellular protease/amidase
VGQGTRREMHNPALIDWIKARSQEAELVLSVCTGALPLAKAGLPHGGTDCCGAGRHRLLPAVLGWLATGSL